MASGNPWSAVSSAASSGLTVVIKIFEFTYALRAVDKQTREYLQTTHHVSENIETARRLRRQRSSLLPADEKKDIDRVIRDTETAVNSVAFLLQPARVDLETEQKIRLSTRGSWVLRDNPNIAAALARLHIAHTTLTSAIVSLRFPRQDPECLSSPQKSKSQKLSLPPSYASVDNELLLWRQKSRSRPKPVASNDSADESDCEFVEMRPAVALRDISIRPESSGSETVDAGDAISHRSIVSVDFQPQIPNHIQPQRRTPYRSWLAYQASKSYEGI